MGSIPDSDSSSATQLPPTLQPVRDAACGGGEASSPLMEVSAEAQSLQELLLTGVAPLSRVPAIYLMSFHIRLSHLDLCFLCRSHLFFINCDHG